MNWPFVSVVVVNYNGRTIVDQCLASLAQQNYPRHRFEVVVVDNASSDESQKLVRQNYSWVRLIQAKRNLGFAAGNNLGFTMSRGEWLALLNSDAAADPQWLAEMMRAGQSADDIGGVASHLVFRDRPTVINGTGLQLYRDGRAGDRDFEIDGRDIRRREGEVFGGCGAAMLLRRTLLDDVGGFDSSLFMYYEDCDFAWRAQRRGWRFVYAPRARVFHGFGGSIGVASPLQTRLVERNRVIVNARHAPIWLAVATGLGSVLRCVRSAWSSATGSTSRRRLIAQVLATMQALMQTPKLAIARLGASRSGDSIYRRWAKPAPRKQSRRCA